MEAKFIYPSITKAYRGDFINLQVNISLVKLIWNGDDELVFSGKHVGYRIDFKFIDDKSHTWFYSLAQKALYEDDLKLIPR